MLKDRMNKQVNTKDNLESALLMKYPMQIIKIPERLRPAKMTVRLLKIRIVKLESTAPKKFDTARKIKI